MKKIDSMVVNIMDISIINHRGILYRIAACAGKSGANIFNLRNNRYYRVIKKTAYRALGSAVKDLR